MVCKYCVLFRFRSFTSTTTSQHHITTSSLQQITKTSRARDIIQHIISINTSTTNPLRTNTDLSTSNNNTTQHTTANKMGLIKAGLLAGAAYGVARKVAHSKQVKDQHRVQQQQQHDLASGYRHQSFCNGQCGGRCNGAPTSAHQPFCSGQCGGQCMSASRGVSPTPSGSAQDYYSSTPTGTREALPAYSSSGVAAKGDVKQ